MRVEAFQRQGLPLRHRYIVQDESGRQLFIDQQSATSRVIIKRERRLLPPILHPLLPVPHSLRKAEFVVAVRTDTLRKLAGKTGDVAVCQAQYLCLGIIRVNYLHLKPPPCR